MKRKEGRKEVGIELERTKGGFYNGSYVLLRSTVYYTVIVRIFYINFIYIIQSYEYFI